jgi:Domain of unknown function (DUF4145)
VNLVMTAGNLIQPNAAYSNACSDSGSPICSSSPFVCPYPDCRVYAQHHWGIVDQLYVNYGVSRGSRECQEDRTVVLALCNSCRRESVFVDGRLLYPLQSGAPAPAKDMPKDVISDFEEARQILPISPRGSAALLRLVVQKLLPHLGASKPEINAGIGELVANGTINMQLQQALDSVRVIGNESVHPGTMDMRDDEETALALFGLVNFVVQKAISEPKEIAEIYASLPANKLAGIEQRDE